MEPMRTAAIFLFLAVVSGCSKDEASPGPTADGGTDGADGPTGPKVTGLAQTCARGTKKTERPVACNGSPDLCERSYDRVVTPVTHNAMANAADGFGTPNQNNAVAKQLADGVRGMMLDAYYFAPEEGVNRTERDDAYTTVDQVYLCHASCAFGKRRMLDTLCDVTKFLDENPGEIVTFIVQNEIADRDLAAVLEASGLGEYAYAHTLGSPWPTLRKMIDDGKRLVVFLEKNGGDPPTLMPAYEGHVWDTPYTFAKTDEFTCKLGRGKAGSPLFLINHWLQRPTSSPALASEANNATVLGGRIDKCTMEGMRPPTFVAVDFYDVGDLFAVVRRANGL